MFFARFANLNGLFRSLFPFRKMVGLFPYPDTVLCMKKIDPILALATLAFLFGIAPGAPGQAAPTASQPTAEPQLAILDTDIGDDIDDAFALALALRSPELKLLGVTSAYGDTELRARLLDRYLSEAGSDIPVFAGVPTPHGNALTQAAYALRDPRSCNAGGSKDRKHDDGVSFLLDQIRAHPGQITLIAIGPLFNIEAAIQRDPETFRKLKRVVMMGGSVYRGYSDGTSVSHTPPDAEWNIRADPAGAKALLASGVPIFMMPLDSTQIHLENEDREAIFAHGSPLTDQLALLYHQWHAHTEGHWLTPTLFDPVAVAYAVKPALCPATPMHLEVDEKGYTRPVEGGSPNAQVCLQSDEKGFLVLLLNRLLTP
jgi:inosine-uridine nucleoside N-ribohydrolase